MRRGLTLAATAACLAAGVHGLDLPAIFGSYQVFQAGKPIQLWGVDDLGTSVSVTFLGQSYPASVANGRWNVTLPTQPAGKPSSPSIAISSSNGHAIVLDDIAFGDVYVCSGQSNMQLSVLATVNASASQAASSMYSEYIRMFQVALLPAYANTTSPQSNLTASIPWSQVGPGNVLGMSAMCYFYGVQLLTSRPGSYVGLIDSSWGGTAIEVWMSPAALQGCGEGQEDRRASKLRASASIQSAISPLTITDDAASSAYTGQHKYRPDPTDPRPLSAVYPSIPSCLYYSMIVPLLPLSVRGFLWYQGEANAGNPVGYEKCFPGMIGQWREDWVQATDGSNDPQAPFIFAQLAAWPNTDNGMIPVQRYAQQAALALPNVGMVVTADMSDPSGSFHPIHPPWKAEVGRRAWLWADNVIYGNTSSPTSGPRPVSVTVDPWDESWGMYHFGVQGGVCAPGTGFTCMGIRVAFDQPLVQRSMFGPWTGQYNGFELMTSNANASQPVTLTGIRTDDPSVLQLNVTWISSGAPALLRYGWHDYPTMPLANAFGLPVGPFNITVPTSTAGPTSGADSAGASGSTRTYPQYYSYVGRE